MSERRSLRVNVISVLALVFLLGVLWLTPEFRGFLGWVESRIPKPAPPGQDTSAEPEPAAKDEAAEEEVLPLHVARAEDGSLIPDSGYHWVSEDDPGDYTVVWCPGCQHLEYPHVIASDTEGRWRPAPGYEWVNSNGVNDMRVAWKPGTPHALYENVVTDEVEGKWVPAPGYDWADSEDPDDFSVVPENPLP
jgi:hypothetical protein